MRIQLYLVIIAFGYLCTCTNGSSERNDTNSRSTDTTSRSLGDGSSQRKRRDSQNPGLAEDRPLCKGKREWMKCESWSFKYSECRSNGGRIKSAHMGKQHSKTECIRGDNWGFKDGYLWVNSGCRATFRLCFEVFGTNTERSLRP